MRDFSKDSTCLPLVCIDNAVKALSQLKGKVFSFEKQLKRYGKMSSQAANKVGKKGVFKPTLMRLRDEGGGNASALSCGGNMTNAGAMQMQNLSTLLTACEGQVFFKQILFGRNIKPFGPKKKIVRCTMPVTNQTTRPRMQLS